MSRQVTIGATILALAGCLAVGFVAGRSLSEEDQPRLDRESICGGADYEQQTAAFERILPDGSPLTMVANNRADLELGEWTSNCRITLDGANVLYIDSRMVRASADDWQQRLLWADEINDDTDLKSVKIGTRALSTPNAAAIYVRCGARDPKNRTQMLSIAVTAQGKARSSSGAHRQDIVDIALRAAHLADTDTGCDAVDSLPDNAPRVA